MTVSDICKKFKSFSLGLEIGPWEDDGSGEVIQITGSSFDADLDGTLRVAQEKANELNKKVVVAVSGDHKEEGLQRREIAVFYPQINASMRSPGRVYLEVPIERPICISGNTFEQARQGLTVHVLGIAEVSYEWPDGGRTRSLIPEPPEGFGLHVIQIRPESKRDLRTEEEFFIAVQHGKKVYFYANAKVVNYAKIFFGLEQGEAKDVKLPAGSYIFTDDCWTVVDPYQWWVTSS